MRNSYLSGNLVIDEIEVQAIVLRNKIADVIMDQFAMEMNHLVFQQLRRCCEACQIDEPSHKDHDCMMFDQQEAWLNYYTSARELINFDKLWSSIEEQVFKTIGVHLKDTWLKYLLHLLKVDVTSAFLMYKNYERKQNEDECLTLGCYDHM